MSSNCRKTKQVGPVEVTTTPEGKVRNCKVNGSYTQVVMLDDKNQMRKRVHLRMVGVKNLKVRQNNIRPGLKPYKDNVDLPALFDVTVTGSSGDPGVLRIEVYLSKPNVNFQNYVSNKRPFEKIPVEVQIQ